MGLSPFKSCSTNYTSTPTPAPNPDPRRWKLLRFWEYTNGYVLKVQYLDATNFEGVKIMVFRGRFPGSSSLRSKALDPHFTPSLNSPVARFRPDAEGISWANDFASKL